MKICVRARAHAREEKVEKTADGTFRVSVKEAATEGRANGAIRRALADYFDIPASRVRVVKGWSGVHKVFEIS
jgi:uncharacterized protein YggU (UPF0235/DUF167 family)